MAEVGVGALQMHRDGVVEPGGDTGRDEFGLETVSLRVEDDVEMPRVSAVGRFGGELKGKAIEQLSVGCGVGPPRRDPEVEMPQLDAEHRPLHRIHSVVESEFVMVVALRLSMIAQGAYSTQKKRARCSCSGPSVQGWDYVLSAYLSITILRVLVKRSDDNR